MEKLKFLQFIETAAKPEKAAYLLYSGQFVQDAYMNILKQSNYEVIRAESNLKQHLTRLKYRSLFSKKKVLFYGGNMDKDSIEILKEYLDQAPTHAVVVLYTLERPKYNRNLPKSVFQIDLRYPGYAWIREYIEYVSRSYGLAWGPETLRLFQSRIGQEYDLIKNYIQSLREQSETATREDIVEIVEDHSTSSMQELYESLVLRKHKKMHYKMLQDLLDGGKEPAQIAYGLLYYVRYLMQAKQLRMTGILLKGCIVEYRKQAFKASGVNLGEQNLFDQSPFFIQRILEAADRITLREIIQIRLQMERQIKISKKGKRFLEDDDFFRSFLNITNQYHILK